jgi:Tol biopolymer transport system component
MRMALAATIVLGLVAAQACAALIERASIGTDGRQGAGEAGASAISADGRFVVFVTASPLVADDSNGQTDVYVRDRLVGTTERVSVGADGAEGNGDSYPARISDDGRYITFDSWASNLVADDTNNAVDVFVRDRLQGTTELLSRTHSGQRIDSGAQTGAMSRDGRYVLFNTSDDYVVTLDANGRIDGFLLDREGGEVECVTLDSEGKAVGGSATALSDDGRFVTFVSDMPGIVAADTNGLYDVFVRDRSTGTTTMASVDSKGQPLGKYCGWGAITGDGRFVAINAFDWSTFGFPEGPTRVYIRDLVEATTQVLGGILPRDPTRGWYGHSISGDARFIAFYSNNDDLVPGDANNRMDAFVYDRESDTVACVSTNWTGASGDDNSSYPLITPGGRLVVFDSEADNLVPYDTNEVQDVFVREWERKSTFTDVPTEDWAWVAVESCAATGIVGGYPDGLYHPDCAVLRDQMAAFIARVLAGGDQRVPASTDGPSFTDVGPVHWAYAYVEYASDAGVVKGYADGTYSPESVMNRAQMPVYIARGAGWISVGEDMTTAPRLFPDVPAGFWAGTAIEACIEHGVLEGYRDGLYHPEFAVTRDQMAVFIWRAFLR